MADRIDSAGRAIAGLLGYNPGPGIYSRLERAIEAMPANVRTQELPGLLKRYKDGVPGWELRETDLEGLIGDAQVIPRQDLLDRVRERSPVYTHKEIVLGGNPAIVFDTPNDSWANFKPSYEQSASALGAGKHHGETRYENYGQGGRDYSELLLLQPGAGNADFNNHWLRLDAGGTRRPADDAVAHARFDTHGDALRINELQSDLGIHNRKMREQNAEYERWARERGVDPGRPASGQEELPFPLEDAWSDILIKRLALEAARKGHRAIEVASPSAVFGKTGNEEDAVASLARMEHFYGKVVPGAIERLGRKMGGVINEPVALIEPIKDPGYGRARSDMYNDSEYVLREAGDFADGYVGRLGSVSHQEAIEALADAIRRGGPVRESAESLRGNMVEAAVSRGWPRAAAETLTNGVMPNLMRRAENLAAMDDSIRNLRNLEISYLQRNVKPSPGRRYLMSDEMRKRILTQGIGASVLAPMLTEDE